ncbi:amino acid ABC transporter permease [Lutibaculum baratangense]|uniref:Glutamate Aspartate transport system permease protein GltJ n=1 Tax=Lutibaculum baratangense AMV1 TaxID=631454 RepID=V4RAY7_9HYPH|nr:amino acid ABC transporter permease [Lutibaculum baratangense]ESR23341.1 Glutamate Aspartate transport system permease protein GltJ [Lutibaculum baratangense AMV1]
MSVEGAAGRAAAAGGGGVAKARLLYDPRFRSWAFQIALVVAVVLFFFWIAGNAARNLQQANIASGFGFLDVRAGFVIAETPIHYTDNSTYGRAFLVGLLNTIIVAFLGIVFATVLGFVIGIARLSKNWLVARLATAYVEVMRNIPLLLQLLFWYKAVLAVLPSPRQGLELPLGVFLNNRGLFIPRPVMETGGGMLLGAIGIAALATYLLARWAKARRMRTGHSFPMLRVGLAIMLGLPFVVYVLAGAPITFDVPELQGFNFTGGKQVSPEFTALLLGLSIYTSAFIAEIVRAGILSVSRGQWEAAGALGVRYGRILRLIIIPQAMRVIIPPLTSQYLNLTKNSSLAVAIGYPDLVAVFAGTVLNQTGQAVEVILMTMAVYLTLSLLTSAFMNWFNARYALVER